MLYQIGVDIGGTFIKIGLFDDSLRLLSKTSIPFPHTDAGQMADRLRAAIDDTLARYEIALCDVSSIGVVLPGSIDPSRQIAVNAYNLDYHNVPLKKILCERFPETPVFLANDADAAALAELYQGAFQGCRSAVLLTLGTGVGGGIILDGHMFRGGCGNGIEIGHVFLLDGGDPCTCGNHGCIESYCSATALANAGKQAMRGDPGGMLASACGGDEEKLDAELVTDCAKAGDPAALAVFNAFAGHLSSACASVFNFLDPQVIAIGGGLCAAGDFLFSRLHEATDRKCFFKNHGIIVPAALGNDAGIIGAALLQRDAT